MQMLGSYDGPTYVTEYARHSVHSVNFYQVCKVLMLSSQRNIEQCSENLEPVACSGPGLTDTECFLEATSSGEAKPATRTDKCSLLFPSWEQFASDAVCV